MPSRTPPDDGRPRPSIRGLAAIALAAIAVIATSPPPPTLQDHVIGQVVMAGGEAIQRELRIHVGDLEDAPTSGNISVGFQAANGLDAGYTDDATITLLSASDRNGSFAPDYTFPVERCAAGCDLRYVIGITAGPGVLPGSVIRFAIDVRVTYSGGYGPMDPSQMRLELEGRTTAPVVPIWAILAGLVALVGGIALAPGLQRRLGSGRQRWPAVALVALPVGMIGWVVATGAVSLVSYRDRINFGGQPTILLAFANPWSIGLLAVLAWATWRGLRRWPDDGGWSLGLAAVGVVGLGGLWFTWVSTTDVVIQPVLLAVQFVILGGIGGLVIGQAWRGHARADDRPWAALAVLGHGIVIAGFAFLAVGSLIDPFSSSPQSLLLLLPAAVVTIAFVRWLRGGRRWLVLFDLIIAALGLLGAWFLSSDLTFSTAPDRFEIEEAAIAVAIVASLVALVTSFHTMPAGRGVKKAAAIPPTADPADEPA